ncbi:hypothetical protein KCV87_11725 [Actinosynnema pretiosum subsp. pretiosum]|uniref:Uncharacterized protein n=2 Tax=Actinosynnema TaxID=40566 RepID=C6WCL9_ACTMD|nr:hypothetical protein [Actinosynnema mirum]ACU35636.1 hypothetical protein Amir_1687 [Actinosynnema mirum DSM 43827]AXX29066.1 hypothetical protein APASM_1701 [Actinosynnema pretiosum subsp. pretiosum]QUF06656.1 hypothetical protein KCV87_11725 [Actinosynnema pretiosum subsp. pretiosum]
MTTNLTPREHAVLRAVAEGRCTLDQGNLMVDGLSCCDQFLGRRLVVSGLIAGTSGPVVLTETGRALLGAPPRAA